MAASEPSTSATSAKKFTSENLDSTCLGLLLTGHLKDRKEKRRNDAIAG